jgi:hypothetical protein
MRAPINIDHTHSRAICREIGERLRFDHFRAEAELPASFKKQVDRLRELEGEPPSIVPAVDHGFGNKPSDERKPRRSMAGYWWRR